jgi:subtilisin family serine protease
MSKPRFHRMLMYVLSAISLTIFAGSLFAQGPGKDGLISVVVKLEDAPLASYKGIVPGLAATVTTVTGEKRLNVRSDRSRKYLTHIVQKMQTVESSILAIASQARVTHRYPVVFGGMTVRIPQDKISAISRLLGVKAVYPDRLQKVDTSTSPYLIKADKMWAALGGQSNGGEGVIVGIIDTGIWPEHPSFSNPDPAGKTYPAPPPSWGGACEAPGDGSTPITCTNKIIGARAFLSSYKAGMGGLPVGEFDSPRDSNGHGTHVASTAAGNGSVAAGIMGSSLGTLSGVAPRAHVAAYKACGPEGCYDSDLVAAINQAVADGVDVINYSIGPTSVYLEDPYSSVDDLAFLDAYSAGVFVATSAGNSGPSADTVNHLGGWTATVAASTNKRTFVSSLKLKAKGGSLKVNGVTVTAGISEATDFVIAADYGDELCLNPFASGTFTGKVVGCKRGVNARVAKGYNVLQGGAAGMVLYNTSGTAQGVSPDNHHLPAIHIDGPEGDKLVSYLATHTDIQATFTGGKAKKTQTDVTASFSSRGGSSQAHGISKPDIAGPGVTILAGNTEEPCDPETKPDELFTIMQGTSMASPHIAGAGALLKQLNPTWTPGQIKSALMTTALTKKVVKDDGRTAAGPFEVGSGRIDLQKAVKPGITFDTAGDEFNTHKNDLWNVNYPSIYVPNLSGTVTVTRTAHSELVSSSKWKASIQAPSDLAISVTPDSFTIPANGDVPLSITINVSSVPSGQVRHATLFIKSGSYRAQIPLTIVKAP